MKNLVLSGFIVALSSCGPVGEPGGDNSAAGNRVGMELSTTPPNAEANNAASAEPAPPPSEWVYRSESSPMDDRRTEFACVRSTNPVELGFPYGSPHGRLCLRNSPQFGRDAYVELEGDGQILCPSYRDCTVRVRFDDDEARNFAAVGAADNSTDVVFIRGRDRFERALRTAARTAVQIEFYRAGQQAFIFPTAGFNWEAGQRAGD